MVITNIELFNQLKTGDRDVFEKWMVTYSGKIEKFAVQYGCSTNQVQQVTEATFRELYNQLTELVDEDQLRLSMYKITLKSLRNMELPYDKENVLPFEEDQQLHEKIINLNDENKVTLLLSYFHGMTEREIEFITGIPDNNVMNLNAESRQQLNRNQQQVEKQLQFLAKSYDRLRFSFTYENVFTEVQVESDPIQKSKSSKKVLISWIAGVVTLLTLITVSVVTGEEYQRSSAEKYVERIKVSFEKEVENKYNELGFPEITDQSDFNFTGQFSDESRSNFDEMIRRYERVLSSNEKVNKKKIKEEYVEILGQLQLPSEMAKQLIKNPLTNDKEKSEEFISLYLEKLYSIENSFHSIYYNHHEIIEAAIVKGTIDIEKFMGNMERYPQEFQKLLIGMEKQNYYPVSIPDMAPFYPQYQSNELSEKIRKALHEDVGGYITMLETQPFINIQGLTYSLDESIDYLIEFEKTLFATDRFASPYGMLSSTYSHLFNILVMDDERNKNETFDENGMVKEEYRVVWEKIADIGEDSPASFIMKKIINEMKASDWKESEIYNRLDSSHISNALSYAQDNNLHNFTIDDYYRFNTITTSIQDADYQLAVEEVYKNFSRDYNLVTLKDADPLIIIGVYYYANEVEDPETMWHLFNNEYVPVSLEEFVKDWTKKDHVLGEVESIYVEDGNSTMNGAQLVPIGYEKDGTIGLEQDGTVDYIARMLFDIKESIWTIYEID